MGMKTHNFRAFVLVGFLASGWLGCMADGTERSGSVSQAEVSRVPTCTAPAGAPIPPACDNGPQRKVWARCHDGVVAGYQTAYTDSFPLPPNVNNDPTIDNYESAVLQAGSDGYAYEVSETSTPESDSDFYIAVGINQASVAFAAGPTANNNPYGFEAPDECSWYSEYSLSQEYSSVYPVLSKPPVQCVEVVAYGNGSSANGCLPKGTHLEFFPGVFPGDPNGPNWIKP
jgi:hypothetical protein